MAPHLTGLVYILAMSLVMFSLLKKPLTASLMSEEDFVRRRNAWLAITVAAFLSHSFWVYICAAGVIVLLTAQRDRNPLALYCMLLVAIPNFEMEVPGFGIVNFLFKMSHTRLLAILILLPMAFKLVQTRFPMTNSQRLNQGLVASFVLLNFIIAATTNNANYTLANIVRNGWDLFLLIWLPFYVFTHALRDLRQLREAVASLMMALALLGIFAVFETLRHWLVFESLRAPLGVPPASLTLYVIRETDGGGALRALTTSGHPIVLGYMMGVGLCLWVAARRSLQPSLMGLVPLGTLALGLLVALSRGPWMGAAAGLLVLALAGPNAGKRFMITSAVLVAVVLGLLMTPYGEKIISYLPFVGSVERGTVDYRVKLFEVSMLVFWDNPILGNFDAIRDPRMEQMRQGQGIIDMVNSYLGVGLQFGIIGVILFVAPFIIAIVMAILRGRSVETEHPSMGITGRALAGAIVAALVTIATTSSIEYIPIIYWPLLGAATAYLGIVTRWQIAQRSAAARPQRVPGRNAGPQAPVPARPGRWVRPARKSIAP
jgi:O-Antigen ligase